MRRRLLPRRGDEASPCSPFSCLASSPCVGKRKPASEESPMGDELHGEPRKNSHREIWSVIFDSRPQTIVDSCAHEDRDADKWKKHQVLHKSCLTKCVAPKMAGNDGLSVWAFGCRLRGANKNKGRARVGPTQAVISQQQVTEIMLPLSLLPHLGTGRQLDSRTD
ncbi:hypothetical protein BHM03_00027799 [Ensete ventricosum]|nr:hypothetical protein BHM03_00027799 [Ensete ventricosum]